MRLWIDTNSARSADRIAELSHIARMKGVEVAIHPLVYLERRRQMRVECTRKGKPFKPGLFDGIVKQHTTFHPLSIDQATAAAWADTLDQRYPTDEAWERAKAATLGGRLRADFQVLPGRMPMTTDWLVALAVEGDPNARVITWDAGEEWRALREMQPPRALTWDEAMAWLDSLPDAPAEPRTT